MDEPLKSIPIIGITAGAIGYIFANQTTTEDKKIDSTWNPDPPKLPPAP